MSRVESFENRINDLLIQETPPLPEMRRLMLEIDDFVNSSDFQQISLEERGRMQSARKDLKSRIRQQEDEAEEAVRRRGQAGKYH